MTKLEKLMKTYDDAQTVRTELEARIPQLEADQKRLQREAETAATAGNLTLYREKRDQAQMAADQVHVIRAQLDAASALQPEQEARDAWQEYTEAYGKNFTKALSEYEAEREKLYASYMALVTGQAAALKIRERLAECCGIDVGDNLQGMTLDRYFPLKTMPVNFPTGRTMTQLNTPDSDFFIRVYGADSAELNRVVRLHQTF